MKSAAILTFAAALLVAVFLLPLQPSAQESDYQEPAEKYSREELAQMLAPIALYPDVLLSQILMASTYPIEVIEAERWVGKNPDLTGDDLETALLEMEWDPSVKALCHFPSILGLMSERITQTTHLGNAFLAQQDEVMDLIQELRVQAHAQGNLADTPEQKVIVEKETIIIEPANPQVIYVPYYDPHYIYGSWWYPNYPPYYWVPRGYRAGRGISYWPGYSFSFTFGSWSYFDWPSRYIYIDTHKRPRYVRHDRWRAKTGPWVHVPTHRRGVAYRDKYTARKYGQYPYRSRSYQPYTRGFPQDDRRGRFRPRDDRGRIDADLLKREQAAQDRQKRIITELNRPQREQRIQREQAERARQMADQTVRERQQRAIELNRQQRERVERDRAVRSRQMSDPVDRARQMRDQAVRERQQREAADLSRQQRSRDNVFNRVDEGMRERRSSERGRISRQEAYDRIRSRGGVIRSNRGGRQEQGRNIR
ncbi:MAG: DUF3300 domain-containing protein [Desulfobulbaceae bacterium]|nr:DUF3300 domain-containing protein [Desulfobulbaceae bacterium]